MKSAGLRVLSWRESQEMGLSNLVFRRQFDQLPGRLRGFDAFEDGIFWDFDFIRWATFALPASRFVYLGRPPEEWFESLVVHSDGKNPGRTIEHALRYDRFLDISGLVRRRKHWSDKSWNDLDVASYAHHYTSWHRIHRAKICLWFEALGQADRLFMDDWDSYSVAALADFIGVPSLAAPPNRTHQSQDKHESLTRLYADKPAKLKSKGARRWQ